MSSCKFKLFFFGNGSFPPWRLFPMSCNLACSVWQMRFWSRRLQSAESLSPSDNKILVPAQRNCSYKKLAFRINVRQAYTHIFHPRLHSYWSTPSVCQGRVAPIFAAPKVRARACLCTNATATIIQYKAHSMGLQGCTESGERNLLFFLITRELLFAPLCSNRV